MADYDVGYLKDYATIQLADAARAGLGSMVRLYIM